MQLLMLKVNLKLNVKISIFEEFIDLPDSFDRSSSLKLPGPVVKAAVRKKVAMENRLFTMFEL